MWALILLAVLIAVAIALLVTQCGGGDSGPPTAAAPAPPVPTAAPPGAPSPNSAADPASAAPDPGTPAPGPASAAPPRTGGDPAGAAALQDRIDQVLRAAPATFTADNGQLTRAGSASVDRIAQMVATAPRTSVTVTGYTAPVDGDPARCQQLSEQRAQAVAQRLIRAGVSPERIHTRGAGHRNPQPTWAASRRAEIAAS